MSRILCIGSENVFSKDLQQTLGFEGYEVSVTPNMGQALQKINLDTISLVVCDIQRLAESDFSLLKSLKTMDIAIDYVPFLYVGLSVEKQDIIKALNLRTGDFIPLPLDKDIFLAQVTAKIMEVQCIKEQLTPQRTQNNYLNFYMLINEVHESLGYIEQMSSVIGNEELGKNEIKEYTDFAKKIHGTSCSLIALINDTLHPDEMEESHKRSA